MAASVVRQNTKHRKDENTIESKERKFEKKSKRNKVSRFNIYSISVEHRSRKLNEMFVFGILFIYYV